MAFLSLTYVFPLIKTKRKWCQETSTAFISRGLRLPDRLRVYIRDSAACGVTPRATERGSWPGQGAGEWPTLERLRFGDHALSGQNMSLSPFLALLNNQKPAVTATSLGPVTRKSPASH